MKLRFLFLLLLVPLSCASLDLPEDDDSGANGGSANSGGKTGSGGRNASGGRAGTGGEPAAMGGSSPSGGASSGGGSSGGGSSSGGSSSGGSANGGSASGGAVSSGGAAAAGGRSSGGAASVGGSGAGGAGSGQCAGKPTYAEWKASSGQMTGDQIMHRCSVLQAGCAGLMSGTDYLFECNQSHVPNCLSQRPEDGNSWTNLGECADGVGGMAGAGG